MTNVVFVGWMLFVALWETTAVAIVFAALRMWTRWRKPASEYALSLAAFIASVAGAVAAPLVLAAPTVRSTLPSSQILRHAALTANGADLFGTFPQFPSIDTIAAIMATMWVAGVIALLVRLAGGWWVARSVIAKADAGGEFIRRTTNRLAARARTRSVRVLESSAVDTPVIVGWRRPTLLLPRGAFVGLSHRQITAVLAHEIAHVRRNDYLVNLLQSFADVLLFFSPAAGWISRVVRAAREFCCDDDAVASIGDRRDYVEALIGLAQMGASTRVHASVGIAGPRLVARVRRLLQEDSMPRLIPLRVAALVGAFVFTVLIGAQISSASALRFPGQDRSTVYKTSDPGVKQPVLAHEVKPQYTDAAKKRRVQGFVEMEAVVQSNGKVRDDIRVMKSLDPDLDAQAVKALKGWRFKPGTKDGTPVNVRVMVEMTFTLG